MYSPNNLRLELGLYHHFLRLFRFAFRDHYGMDVVLQHHCEHARCQADVVKQQYEKKEKALDARSTELDQRKDAIEKSRRLPWREKEELAVLRMLKASVEWLVNQLPDTSRIKGLLKRTLDGEDLTKQPGLDASERQMKRKYQIAR